LNTVKGDPDYRKLLLMDFCKYEAGGITSRFPERGMIETAFKS